MPPSLLSARFANDSLCTEWPATHTRAPSPWPSPQGEGTGSWMSRLYDSLNPLRGRFEHNNQPYFQTQRFSKP